MPSAREDATIYLGPFASIDLVNVATLYKPGELGKHVVIGGREWQLVQLDSGAVAANGVGVVASGQLAYWKDKANYIVTNDFRQALGASTGCRNEVAGLFTNAVTASYSTYLQIKGKSFVSVKLKSSSPAVGDWIVGDNTASTAQADVVAVATAPTVQPIGKANAAGSSVTTIGVDLDVPIVE